MSVYGSGTYLLPNQVYNVTLQIPGVEPYSFTFTSKYAPLYTTAKTVRSDCGALLDGVNDDGIWYAIWLVSKNAEDLLVRKGRVEEQDTAAEQTAAVQEALNESRQLKNAFHQYVRYQAALDLVRAAYLTMAGQAGQIQKKLGDLTLLRETRPPSLDSMIKSLQEERDRWEERLSSTGPAAIAGAVRGGSANPYPLSTRRSF